MFEFPVEGINDEASEEFNSGIEATLNNFQIDQANIQSPPAKRAIRFQSLNFNRPAYKNKTSSLRVISNEHNGEEIYNFLVQRMQVVPALSCILDENKHCILQVVPKKKSGKIEPRRGGWWSEKIKLLRYGKKPDYSVVDFDTIHFDLPKKASHETSDEVVVMPRSGSNFSGEKIRNFLLRYAHRVPEITIMLNSAGKCILKAKAEIPIKFALSYEWWLARRKILAGQIEPVYMAQGNKAKKIQTFENRTYETKSCLAINAPNSNVVEVHAYILERIALTPELECVIHEATNVCYLQTKLDENNQRPAYSFLWWYYQVKKLKNDILQSPVPKKLTPFKFFSTSMNKDYEYEVEGYIPGRYPEEDVFAIINTLLPGEKDDDESNEPYLKEPSFEEERIENSDASFLPRME